MHPPTTDGSSNQHAPNELSTANRWIRWRLHDGQKRPIAWDGQRFTSYHEHAQWRTLAAAPLDTLGTDGIGVSFAQPIVVDGHQLLALDLDACRHQDTGAIEPWAKTLIKRLGRTYTEVTPSGTGLRAFVLVRNLPALHRSKFHPLNSSLVDGLTKTVNCQVFGGGNTGFVTFTGQRLPGCDNVVRVDNLDWWHEVFVEPLTGGLVGEDLAPRVGFGPAPTMEEIDNRVRSTEVGRALADCAWREALPDLKSNSEAFALLEQAVVAAARWHEEEALDYLTTECPAWQGPGLRECYSDREWVRKDIRRVTSTGPAFTELEDEAEGMGMGEEAEAEAPAAADPLDYMAPAPVAGLPPAEPPKKAKKKPWTRMGLAELLATPQPPWQIQGYVRCKQVGLLAAFPGVGKSTLAAAWMMSTLAGVPWCGKKVRQGSVVALVGENRRGFANTCDAYQRKHGLPAPRDGDYLEIVDYRLPLSGAEGQARLFELLADVTEAHGGRKPALLVVDTLSSHWADSEDTAEVMAPAMRTLATIAERWECSVLILHHTTKAKGKGLMPELADVRGSLAAAGNTDFTFGMCQPQPGVAHLGALKVKNDKEPPLVKLLLTEVPCGHDSDGEEVTAGCFDNQFHEPERDEVEATKKADADMRKILVALNGLGTASKTAIAETAQIRKQRAYALIDVAIAKGMVEALTGGRTTTYKVTNKGLTGCVFQAVENTEILANGFSQEG